MPSIEENQNMLNQEQADTLLDYSKVKPEKISVIDNDVTYIINLKRDGTIKDLGLMGTKPNCHYFTKHDIDGNVIEIYKRIIDKKTNVPDFPNYIKNERLRNWFNKYIYSVEQDMVASKYKYQAYVSLTINEDGTASNTPILDSIYIQSPKNFILKNIDPRLRVTPCDYWFRDLNFIWYTLRIDDDYNLYYNIWTFILSKSKLQESLTKLTNNVFTDSYVQTITDFYNKHLDYFKEDFIGLQIRWNDVEKYIDRVYIRTTRDYFENKENYNLFSNKVKPQNY